MIIFYIESQEAIRTFLLETECFSLTMCNGSVNKRHFGSRNPFF